jgi:hypothetical protein
MLAATVYLGTQLYAKPDPAMSAPGSTAPLLWLVACWVIFYMVMTIVNVVTYTAELYGDTSYLIFSLPLRGRQILGSRVVLMIVDTLLTLAGGMASVITLACCAPGDGARIRPVVGRFLLTGDYWLLCLITLVLIICGMMVFYFGITLGKTVSSTRKGIGNLLSTVVIVVVLWIMLRVTVWLSSYSEAVIRLNPWIHLGNTITGTLSIPLLPLIFCLIVGVGAFCLTSWFMDHRLNL